MTVSPPAGPGPAQGTGPLVRSARPADVASIAACLAGGQLVPGAEDPADLAPYSAALAEAQRAPSDVLVAEVDGRVVGVCQLVVFRHLSHRGGLCAELESVHVLADQRGRGIGAALAAAAEARARSLGCYRLQLTSNRVRLDAHRFWRRQGYEESHVGFKKPLG